MPLTEPRLISLREAAGSTVVSMPVEMAAGLASRQIATVSPTSSGEWSVSNIAKVGVISLGGIEVMIEPKVPLERLFYLLARGRGWGTWFEENVQLGTIDELYPAIAEAFISWAERALGSGVLRGYRETRSAEPAIRGKWLVSEQIRIRHGMPLPAELQYDDFTSDIAENKLVRSAARRVLAFPRLSDAIYARLMRIDRQLVDVDVLTRGVRLPLVQFDRRNDHYRPAIALSELILTNGSFDHRVASTSATGFLLDLPQVFEQFVEAEVTRAAIAHGGQVIAQHVSTLDRDGNARIKPDLLWSHGGRIRAVFDAKYKAEKPAGFPNADVYQMLAYCIRHQLSTGHLIYAAGNEVLRSYLIEQAGVVIKCHSLALDKSPVEMSRQIDEIVAMSIEEEDLEPDLCIHGSEPELCGYCNSPATRHVAYSDRSRSGHEKLLVFCPEITTDSLLHFNRQGDSYRLRAYVGRLAGQAPWMQPDASTADDFIRIYQPDPRIDVAGEYLKVEEIDRWRAIITAHNDRLGIGSANS